MAAVSSSLKAVSGVKSDILLQDSRTPRYTLPFIVKLLLLAAQAHSKLHLENLRTPDCSIFQRLGGFFSSQNVKPLLNKFNISIQHSLRSINLTS